MRSGVLLAVATRTLASQWPLVLGPVVFGLVVAAALYAVGQPGRRDERWARQAARIPNALERITGIPGWAAAVIGVGLLAPVLSVVGFYTDVAWHIDFGRDKVLFTPPHTMIALGLAMIPLSAAVGIVFATITDADVGLRWGMWRVPWSILPLIVFGFGAFAGFPLDDLWHASYGVDVTLWSPTHLMMVGAGGLSTISLWMVLREAGVSPRQGVWPAVVYGVLAAVTLVRLSTFQAEFDLAVPQFQLLFQPVIIELAAAVGLVAGRLIFGRGGALVMAVGFVVLRAAIALLVGPVLGYTVPRFPLYLAAAIAVEVVATALGTERQLRFAVGAGLGVASAGLAGEWWWSHLWGHHPWPASMFPQALLVGGLAAVGAAVLGVAAGAFIAGRPIGTRGPVVAAAVAAVVVSLVVPAPRDTGRVSGRLALDRRGDQAVVRLDLQPADAAAQARWFDVVSWQGGGMIRTTMRPVSEGRYESSRPMPISDDWKTVVRLHRGGELLGLAVYLPEDREIRAPLVPAVDGERSFVADTRLMLRETKAGPAWPRLVVYFIIALFTVLATAVVARVGQRIHAPDRPGRRLSHPAVLVNQSGSVSS